MGTPSSPPSTDASTHHGTSGCRGPPCSHGQTPQPPSCKSRSQWLQGLLHGVRHDKATPTRTCTRSQSDRADTACLHHAWHVAFKGPPCGRVHKTRTASVCLWCCACPGVWQGCCVCMGPSRVRGGPCSTTLHVIVRVWVHSHRSEGAPVQLIHPAASQSGGHPQANGCHGGLQTGSTSPWPANHNGVRLDSTKHDQRHGYEHVCDRGLPLALSPVHKTLCPAPWEALRCDGGRRPGTVGPSSGIVFHTPWSRHAHRPEVVVLFRQESRGNEEPRAEPTLHVLAL